METKESVMETRRQWVMDAIGLGERIRRLEHDYGVQQAVVLREQELLENIKEAIRLLLKERNKMKKVNIARA